MLRMPIRRFLSWFLAVSIFLTMPEILAAAETAGATEGESGGAKEAATGATPSNPVHHCAQQDDDIDYTDWSYVYFGSYPQTEVTGTALTSAIAGADYDKNGDAWVNGTKYRRISKSETNYDGYFGNQEYRYFKWERIRWKALQNDGETLFVVADLALDCKRFTERGVSVTWEHSGLRDWLNTEFYGTAFAEAEQDAIAVKTVANEDNYLYQDCVSGNDTDDAVFLLSIREATSPEYGFCEEYYKKSAVRRVAPSAYARARGVTVNESEEFMNNCFWWLRTPGLGNSCAVAVRHDGQFYPDGEGMWKDDYACVPAMYISLSSDLWLTEDDGSSGLGGGGKKAAFVTPANPKYDGETDETEWSHVYFGRYPQTEVTGENLAPEITGASYDKNGDAWVLGNKYRRISKEDTTSDTRFGDQKYRYFKWEKIKWRVLSNDGETLFLMADSGIDCERYHTESVSVTWENASLRTWLNGSFSQTAFTERERSAVLEWDVENKSNPEYNTAGGAATKDRVYLLSLEEARNPAYGFDDFRAVSATRQLQSSGYAKARGSYTGYFSGNCQWWLRSPGGARTSAALVGDNGNLSQDGVNVNSDSWVCAPVLHLPLKSDVWQEAKEEAGEEGVFSNPVHACRKDEDATGYTDVTDFSHVYFGSYPQTEVTDEELAARIDLELGKQGGESNGSDVWIDGSKYRRVQKDGGNGASSGGRTYRYFKWERIRWRILRCEDSTLFLMADQGLDCQKFNEKGEGNHWDESMVRSWLNETFYQTAFSAGERNAIVKWDVDQSDDEYECSGNNTKDFIYLLSASEAVNESYGFCADGDDSASRWAGSSEYARAMGVSALEAYGDCDYWLRTGTGTGTYVSSVYGGGYVARWVASVSDEGMACVPVLHVKKNSRRLYFWDDGAHEHDFQAEMTKHATCTQTGVRTYLCECGEQYAEAIPAAGHRAVTDPAVAPTETAEGKTEGSHCGVCGAVLKAQLKVPATGAQTVNPGGNGKQPGTGNGNVQTKKKKQTIRASSRQITWRSKTVPFKSKPVSLKARSSGNGKLSYKSSNKKVATVDAKGRITARSYGQATITIKAAATGQYLKASKKIKVTVVPGSIQKLRGSVEKSGICFRMKKDNTVSGYVVWFSESEKFNNKSTVKLTLKGPRDKITISKMAGNRTYYFAIRHYKKVKSKTYYGPWSEVWSFRP